jgi:hypothetical protein
MGKIFGISDLPVTIFTTPLEPVKVPKHPAEFCSPRKINVTHDTVALSPKAGKSGLVRKFIDKVSTGFLKIGKK